MTGDGPSGLDNYRVLCIGRLLLDIVAQPVERLPDPEEAIEIEAARVSPGGSAANTAIELGLFGIQSYVAGTIGSDSLSMRLRAALQAQHVRTEKLWPLEGECSSFCFVSLREDGRPSYLYYLGSDSRIALRQLEESLGLYAFIRQQLITHVHIAGVNLLPQLDGPPLITFLSRLRQRCPTVTVSIDTAKVLARAKLNAAALPYIDIFLCNEREGWAFADTPDVEVMGNTIAPSDGSGALLGVVKLGRRGAAAFHRDLGGPIVEAGYQVPVRNLNGAGDAFAAGLLAELFRSGESLQNMQHEQIRALLRAANQRAAEFVATGLEGVKVGPKSLDPEKPLKKYHLSGSLDARGADRAAFLSADHAKRFDAFRQIPDPIMDRWIKRLQELLNASKFDRREGSILDVGCGTGRFTVPLARQFPDMQVVALDRAGAMLDQLQEKKEKFELSNLTIVEGDFEETGFEREFDLAFFSEVIHLMWNLKAGFEQVYKKLTPGGVVAIRTPAHWQIEEHEWYDFFPGTRDIDLRRHRDVDLILRNLSELGFRKLQVQHVDESVWMQCKQYIAGHAGKCYSTLHLVDEEIFRECVDGMKDRLAGKEWIKKCMQMSLVTAQRPAEAQSRFNR